MSKVQLTAGLLLFAGAGYTGYEMVERQAEIISGITVQAMFGDTDTRGEQLLAGHISQAEQERNLFGVSTVAFAMGGAALVMADVKDRQAHLPESEETDLIAT